MNKGFTLIEVLVVMAISCLLFGAGGFIFFDTFRSFVFYYERDILVQLLEEARNKAMNNFNNQSVHFQYKKYPTITFENLSGNVASTTWFVISDGKRQSVIMVSKNGRINW